MSGVSNKTGDGVKDKGPKYVIVSNIAENMVLFLMLLNSVIYPSVSSAIYLVVTMSLTGISLTRDKKKVQFKYGLSIASLVVTVLIMIAKGVTLILLNHEGEIYLSSDERLLYDSLGVRID